jgi:hypothetical protein
METTTMATNTLLTRLNRIQKALAGTLSRGRRSALMDELFEIDAALDRRERVR